MLLLQCQEMGALRHFYSSFLARLNQHVPLPLSLTPRQLTLLHFSHLQSSCLVSSPYASQQEVKPTCFPHRSKTTMGKSGLSSGLRQGTGLAPLASSSTTPGLYCRLQSCHWSCPTSVIYLPHPSGGPVSACSSRNLYAHIQSSTCKLPTCLKIE